MFIHITYTDRTQFDLETSRVSVGYFNHVLKEMTSASDRAAKFALVLGTKKITKTTGGNVMDMSGMTIREMEDIESFWVEEN